jgi:hypothetical protein
LFLGSYRLLTPDYVDYAFSNDSSIEQEKELEQARADQAQLELLKNELAAQEVQWKEAYDVLMAENRSFEDVRLGGTFGGTVATTLRNMSGRKGRVWKPDYPWRLKRQMHQQNNDVRSMQASMK